MRVRQCFNGAVEKEGCVKMKSSSDFLPCHCAPTEMSVVCWANVVAASSAELKSADK